MAQIPKHADWMKQVSSMRLDMSIRGLMNAISAEVKLYEQAFSPMAKRNIALGIHEKIVAFAAKRKTLDNSPMAKELADLDAAALEQSHVIAASHKYEYVSCIGFGHRTAKFDQNVFLAQHNGNASPRVEY